jgi:hypothetical protein
MNDASTPSTPSTHPRFRVLLLRVLGAELIVWILLWLLQSRYAS